MNIKLTLTQFGILNKPVTLGVVWMSLLVFCSSSAVAQEAKTEADMKPYKTTIPSTEISFEMLPVKGGEYVLGSPDGEKDRKDDEGPQVKVKVEPFWMGKYEVTWDEYDIFSFRLDELRRQKLKLPVTEREKLADAVTRPTKPYTDMTFGMGHTDGYPAICMTQLAAKHYCKWLSQKTGHYYRLPTEVEWEYVCRAGTKTAYSFGDDVTKLKEYGWYYDLTEDGYQKVGQKKPNPWGFYDMHGNVSEWCIDHYDESIYAEYAKKKSNAGLFNPTNPEELYPRVTRGGSWYDDPDGLRSAARHPSDAEWKQQDPQIPKSIWYHTDALHVGFRIVRPLKPRSEKERKEKFIDPPFTKNERD